MNQLARFGLILSIICLAATLVLAVTYEITKPKIDAELRREEESALKAILPEAETFTERAIDGIEYFEAVKNANTIGYCIRITASGYNGYIRMIVGIDTNGMIEGVQILEHQETPGLGAKIDEIRPGETHPWFLKQFRGKPARTIAVKKDIDAITGATVSSKSVTNAIRQTADEFLTKVKK